MSRNVIISDPGGQRTLGEEELPLRIGSGAGADIRLPGALSTDSVALVGTLDGRPFVQLSGDCAEFGL